MPTIDQGIEYLKAKRLKYGGTGHIGRIVVSEEARAEAIANKPDSEGRQRTRIALETYDPDTYSAFNETVELLMEMCGYNPILAVWTLIGLVKMNGATGTQLVHDELSKSHDWEQELRAAKTAWRLKRRRQP